MKISASINKILAQEVEPAFAQRSRYILEAIENNQPAKILDAGCGRGFYVKLFTYLGFAQKIVGIDINEVYLQKARQIARDNKKVVLKQGSIYKIPYPDNHFDCVVCSEVLEHLDDDSAALKELYRVLKPQGLLLVTVPHYRFPLIWDPLNWILMKTFRTHVRKNIWWLAGIWAAHERLYTKKALVSLLTKQDFSIANVKDVINWSWPFSHFWLYGIGKNLVERAGAKNFDRFNFT